MNPVLDLAGIGVGPFNLSVAALLHGSELNASFYESKAQFCWHRGMMLPGAQLQTSYLKDLVTPVDPTNPHSFLAYLVAKRRFYPFLNASQGAVTRQEFADYLGWVAGRLDNLRFGTRVERVDFDQNHFVLQLGSETVHARHLSVAVGKRPLVPACARPLLSEHCFHAIDIGLRTLDLRGKRVAVIGGGQTGAEIVLNALDGLWGAPASVSWLSRRPNFQPLDETPFTNEWFTPDYVDAFHALPLLRRSRIVAEQKLASDGISPQTLQALYQRFYRLVHLEGGGHRLRLRPHRELISLQRGAAYTLGLQNGHDGAREQEQADLVILCTGFADHFPDCLASLRAELQLDEDGKLRLNSHFAAAWNGPRGNRLYVLNAGRHSHGIAEPQLSLMAWRSARIINDVLGRRRFDTAENTSFVDWASGDWERAVA